MPSGQFSRNCFKPQEILHNLKLQGKAISMNSPLNYKWIQCRARHVLEAVHDPSQLSNPSFSTHFRVNVNTISCRLDAVLDWIYARKSVAACSR